MLTSVADTGRPAPCFTPGNGPKTEKTGPFFVLVVRRRRTWTADFWLTTHQEAQRKAVSASRESPDGPAV